MLTIDFSTNPNGKLFADLFSDIRMKSLAFEPGTECEIMYRSIFMGYAKIEETRSFPFARISDVAALLNCGKRAAYQAAMLNKFYNKGEMLAPETILQHIVFSWISRSRAQEEMIKEWWNEKKLISSQN